MLKQVNWKFYGISAAAAAVVCLFINWKITAGIILGTLCYFANLKLAEKKFPSLNDKFQAIGGALGVIALEGFITIAMALATWFIGRLPCFIAGFVSMIVPNFYFFILCLKK